MNPRETDLSIITTCYLTWNKSKDNAFNITVDDKCEVYLVYVIILVSHYLEKSGVMMHFLRIVKFIFKHKMH